MRFKPLTWKKMLCRRAPLLLLLAPSGFVLQGCYDAFPAFAAWYHGKAYPVFSHTWQWVFSFTRYSVAEMLLYAVVLSLAVYTLCTAVQLVRKRGRLLRLAAFCMTLLTLAGGLWGAFVGLWGLNYKHDSLCADLGLTVQQRPTADLEALCRFLIGEAAALRPNCPQDDTGVYTCGRDALQALAQAPKCYAALGAQQAAFAAVYYPPKAILASAPLCHTNITGIFIPFTMEANVNIASPALLRYSTACHEMAHLYGYAREEEANFIAFLACRASDEAAVRYSGTMLALIHSMNALYRADADAYRALAQTYTPAMRCDLDAYNAFWAQYQGKAAQTSQQNNDRYLKAMGQRDGVQSYGRMTDLLLAWYALS